jgi:hypothetical protein
MVKTEGSVHSANAVSLAALFLAMGAAAQASSAGDAFYEALLGRPEAASPRELISNPGRYVGRAVTTRGRLERTRRRPDPFHLATHHGVLLLKLEPEVAGLVVNRAAEWVGREVEAAGLFHRDAGAGGRGAHAVRAWRVAPLGGEPPGAAGPAPAAPLVLLEDLIYARGGHDGRLVRVRGVVRGPAGDLPGATRQRADDWVLKDGYFAVWVGGRKPVAAADSTLAVEVVGVPTTAAGVVRIAARDVAAIDPSQVIASRPPVNAGPQATAAPRVAFTHPGPGDLGPRGCVIIQFSHAIDPASLRDGVRARYEGAHPEPTRVAIEYRHRHRALVITPEEPPDGRALVVELLDVVVDVDGRGLAPRAGGAPRGDVVEEIRFTNAS